MTDHEEFLAKVSENIKSAGQDTGFIGLTNIWLRTAIQYTYGHNFMWLGRPILQVPQDIYLVQELVWSIKPDLIIETGVARGGSLILCASMLAMLDYADAVKAGHDLAINSPKRQVVGVDIEIRKHNREAIETHPMGNYIKLIEGSSISADTVRQVHEIAKGKNKVLVFLDSDHTHDHVLAELKAYAPLTTLGSYCVVWDSGVEEMPSALFTSRPWKKGSNPKTAVLEYLRCLESNKEPMKFEIDKFLEHKLMITSVSDGFLKRIA